jgi:hypothetical protein
MRFRNRALVVIGFAAAMAYLEAAVVVYLQRALNITPDRLFPLRGPEMVGDLAAIEVGREFATLVMLIGIGCLAGRAWLDRLAWTAVAFGVWDVLYYGWLWVFIGWPHSPTTWDVLFLIPVPWIGPVWAPVAVSVALIGFGLAAAQQVGRGRVLRPDWSEVVLAVAGGVLVVVSFTADSARIMAGGLPGWYPWPSFVAGVALATLGAARVLRRGTEKTQAGALTGV